MVEEIRPPLAKPAGDIERAEAALEEETVVEGLQILFEGAVREVVADAGGGFGGEEMAAVKVEGGAAFFEGDVVGVDAAEGDAGGEGFKFPAGAEPRFADGPIQRGEIEIFPHVDAEEFAERRENGGGEGAVEADGGGLGGEIGLGVERERGVEEEGGDVGGELGERAGVEPDGDGAGGKPGGGKRTGGQVEFEGDELEAGGAEGAAQEGADAAGAGVEGEGEGIGGELEAGGDGGVAE